MDGDATARADQAEWRRARKAVVPAERLNPLEAPDVQ
jgi:hypothetical protein